MGGETQFFKPNQSSNLEFYFPRDEHANNYITDAIQCYWIIEIMKYFAWHHLCLLAYNGVKCVLTIWITLRHLGSSPVFCVIVVSLSSSCVLHADCCQCLWIVHYWLPYRFSLTFMNSFFLRVRCFWYLVRRVWRYQRGNQNLYVEEEQTTQWPKEKVQKDK
jgi:hypothetical protein